MAHFLQVNRFLEEGQELKMGVRGGRRREGEGELNSKVVPDQLSTFGNNP